MLCSGNEAFTSHIQKGATSCFIFIQKKGGEEKRKFFEQQPLLKREEKNSVPTKWMGGII